METPRFPTPAIWFPKRTGEFWTRSDVPEEHVREQVMPLEELRVMDLIEQDYNVTDEIKAVATPGHTPGHMSYLISSSGEKGFVIGDVTHTPAQARYTHWNPTFDIDNIQSRETRHKILDQLEADGSLVSAGHYPEPGFGRYLRQDGRRVWVPL